MSCVRFLYNWKDQETYSFLMFSGEYKKGTPVSNGFMIKAQPLFTYFDLLLKL